MLTTQEPQLHQERLRQIEIETFDTELDMLNRFVDFVIELDPDILTGWELQLSSWGYLNARSNSYGMFQSYTFQCP